MTGPDSLPDRIATFGGLLRYLRRRVRLTQRELSIAVGYSEAQIARLEGGQRLPDPDVVRGRFVEALDLRNEPALAARLVELAEQSRDTSFVESDPYSAAAAPAARHGNLPLPLTRFIGRERDIAQVAHLLTVHRPVTLTGAGGVGKTRLAFEVCRVVEGGFSDGVWLVELAPLAEPAQVARSAAEAFGIPDDPTRMPAKALATYLKDKHLLLVLDNCEHLVAACAELAEALLRTSAGLAILATSREVLRVPGEMAWRVPSLATPDPAHLPPLERVIEAEAIQLFLEHAFAAQHGFELTPANVAAIAQICHRLDGIPLAIEIAAAQTAAMSPQEIAARLEDRFALLMRGHRAVLPRQQTLWSTLDWSCQSLSEPERVLLARLSVFADGWTAEAAEAVCADPGEARDRAFLPLASDILPLLLSLVGKSLVAADTRRGAGHAGRTRYRMLETVRQFAALRLNEAGEADVIRERFAAYLIALGTSSPGEPPATSLSNRLEAELLNVRELLVWAHSQPDGGEMSLRLVTALNVLWEQRGHLTEPLAGLEEGLAHCTGPATLRIKALTSLLRFRAWCGYNLTRWASHARELEILSEQIEDSILRIEGLWWAGVAALHRFDYDHALDLYKWCLGRSQEAQYAHGICAALLGLALAQMMQGEEASAVICFYQALQHAREHDLRGDVFLAIAYHANFDIHAALAECEVEVALRRLRGSREELGAVLQVYAQILLVRGDAVRSQRVLDECLALWRNLDVQYSFGSGTAQTLLDMGQAAWLQGEPVLARTRYEQSQAIYRMAGNLHRVAQADVLIGYTLLAQGDLNRAADTLPQGLTLYRELGHLAGLVLALTAVAALAESWGSRHMAAQLYAAASNVHRHRLLTVTTWPAELLIQEREIAAARTRLSGEEFAGAWAEGVRMTLEQASEAAMSLLTDRDGESRGMAHRPA